jgi:hypothetical protein
MTIKEVYMEEKAIVPYSDMEKMAAVMGKSMLFGKSGDQLLALMLIAQSEGIHPARAAQEYDVIQGRPALKGVSALARFQEAGGKVEWKERSDAKAEAIFSHPQSSPVLVTWDMAKASRMGLATKDNWKKQPGIMLQWRCVAEGVRVCYPACLNRMYLVEEVQDFEPVRNVTPEDEDIARLQDVRDSRGEYAPPITEGPPAEKGDGIRMAMRDLWAELNSLAAKKYEGADVFTPEQKQDMNADRHPGGKDPIPSQSALDHLQRVWEKWKTMADVIIERREALDKELEDGFHTDIGKAD